MEILGNGFHWQKWMSFLLLACAVLAFRTLDNPGYTRQFIARFVHDCRDFKGVLNKCHVWKDLGFCFKYRREMQHVCNKTCQYCVPGQKQWQIIDRVWGRVRDPAGKPVGVHERDSASVIQHKAGPAIQILGKERPPQVETAANAIATQLERGVHKDSQASPSVLGWLPKVRAGLQSTKAPARIKSETKYEETKEKLLTPQATSSTATVDQDQSGESINRQASISGKTQMDAPLRKPKPPDYVGKQVTVNFNEKPETEETLKQSPPPNYFRAKENEEDIEKSEEEKIRMATQSIKNVLKLFGNDYRDDHEKLKLVTQSAKDLPAHSKSLEISRELAGIQREIDTQTQSQDRSAENAQAISRQIGRELTTNESGNRMANVPNYALISTKGSKDWKNLAHVLAIQLKGVLNHMEDREKENQYDKDRMEEEMMMMTQQQDDDDDPDYDGDYYDDDMNERRHSVLMPLATNSSEKAFKKFSLENKRPQRLKYESSVDEKRLIHQDVKKLSKLEMLYKSQGRNSSNH